MEEAQFLEISESVDKTLPHDGIFKLFLGSDIKSISVKHSLKRLHVLTELLVSRVKPL